MLLGVAIFLSANCLAAHPLTLYASLPALDHPVLSPDGNRLAFLRRTKDESLLAIIDVTTRKLLTGLNLHDAVVEDLAWADNDRLLITSASSTMPWEFIGERVVWHLLEVFDLAKHTQTGLPHLRDMAGLRMMNVIRDRPEVRRIAGHTVLFLRGVYLEDEVLPALIRVDLDSGRQTMVRAGRAPLDTWSVDAQGNLAALQQHDSESGKWAISLWRDKGFVEVLSGVAAVEAPEILGFSADDASLLLSIEEEGHPVFRALGLKDGKLGPPQRDLSRYDALVPDRIGLHALGGEVVEDDSHYRFFDPVLDARWAAAIRPFAGAHIQFCSASEDFTRIVLRVEDQDHGLVFELVDLEAGKASPIGDVYEGLETPIPVQSIRYAAADGLTIPAYLTLPPGRLEKALPLVVLVHGGPAERDSADFDWMAQALADQGYAVLQPNFRGSSVDSDFLRAGYGEFGRKMQSDLADGVRHLVEQGLIDPGRVCIAGASYGGYAALAGATLDPARYRCAVSIAGLADLRDFLRWLDSRMGSPANEAHRYWDRFLGIRGLDDPVLPTISPIEHVAAVRAPVLLIHGKEDTVVPLQQSEAMFDALRRAGKRVQFVKLAADGHYLWRATSRQQTLKAMVDFLHAENPAE